MWQRIVNWENVYSNSPNIPRGADWPGAWVGPAEDFRARMLDAGRVRLGLRYGDAARNVFDLYMPEGEVRGLVVFVHGGFWMALDQSYWAHLAQGPLSHGFAVAFPTYTLAPEARLSRITREIGQAIGAAASLIEGPVHLAGHSAGGHLVTRMVCADSPLPPGLRARIGRVLSISGLHDLRPLQRTSRAEALGLFDDAEAIAESPALQRPLDGVQLICWVGAMETSEFLRQNALLGSIWLGCGAATRVEVEPDRHHFNICDGLMDPDHPMVTSLLG